MGEAGLLLMRAHLGLTLPAPLAGAAAADKGDCDPVVNHPARHGGTNGDDDAGQFVTRHVGEGDLFVAGPAVPVAAAQTSGPDLDDDAVGRRRRVSHLADFGYAANGINNNCAHNSHCAGS
ncbi:hypothetical protein GCM10023354_02010 [Garicola koreensis]